jgi:hypothetical protein
VDQALASGLTNRLPVLHVASGAIVSFASKRITLHAAGASGLEQLSEVKSREPITALLGAPNAPVIFYGTNAGNVFRVAIGATKIGPQKKIGSFERNVNSIRASTDGTQLFVGGMGFLATFALADGTCVLVSKREISCRSIEVITDQWLLLNQGMHGFTLYDTSAAQLRSDTVQKLPSAIDRLVCSADSKQVLALTQTPLSLGLYSIDLAG